MPTYIHKIRKRLICNALDKYQECPSNLYVFWEKVQDTIPKEIFLAAMIEFTREPMYTSSAAHTPVRTSSTSHMDA